MKTDDAMKDGTVAVRLSGQLRRALERERQKRSAQAGAEVKTSAIIRSILEQALFPKRGRSAAARAVG